MKILKIGSMILALYLVSTLLLACGSEAGLSENQTATVQRGDLTTDITGVGNLALSDKVDLAFKMDGTVEEVLVEEGESVEEGQLLAKLDTSAWEDYIAGLEDKVTAAERNVTAAERQLISKERALVTAERQITTKEYAVRQAQFDLQTAENSLSQIADVKKVQDEIDNAEYALKFAEGMLAGQFGGGAIIDFTYWSNLKTLAEQQLANATKKLQEILAGTSITASSDVLLEVARKQLQVEQKQTGLEQAHLDVEDAKQAVEDAEKTIEDAQTAIKDAEKALAKARKALDDARGTSPEIAAPFDGFITRVNVEGGDIVKKGAVAVTIADPIKFEAEVMVTEANISKVKVGGTASVQVEAMPGVSLPANVTHIAPTATIQSGVVNYKVRVEIESFQSVTPGQQQATDNITSGNITSVAPFGRAGQVFGSGNLTQEQIDQMRQQRQQAAGGQFGRGSQGFGSGNLTQEQIDQMIQQRQQAQAGQPGGQQQQTSTIVSGDFQLKEGLTVTVSIIVQQKSNVLLIPNAAVVTKGRQTYAQVLTSSGTIEERLITVGISNWQYTEVVEGLSEGEPVILPKATATTPTTQQQGGQGGMRVPGMGGFGR